MTTDMQVRHNPAQHRYELRQGGQVLGIAAYQPQGETLVFTHTEVEDGHEGQGLGTRLVRSALDDVRAQGQTVVPQCPFVAAFLEEHPDYGDLVAGR